MRIWLRLLVLSLSLLPISALAGNFNITPTTVWLSDDEQAQDVQIVNAGGADVRLSVNMYPWTQLPNRPNVQCGKKQETGEPAPTPAELEACASLVNHGNYYPELFSLRPGERRNIRVGVCVNQQAADQAPDAHCITQTSVEQTYRLIVRELPPPPGASVKGFALTVVGKMDMPIFVPPTDVNAKPIPKIGSVSVSHGTFQAALLNEGTLHFRQSTLAVAATDDAGKVVWRDTLYPFYVLAHGTQVVTDPMPKGICERSKTVAIRWTLRDKLGEQTATTRSITCK